MANDLFSALRTYLTKVSGGEKSPQEVAAAINAWARETGETIKVRVEEEIARSAKKMGFAKQSDLDRLAREVDSLKAKINGKTAPKKSAAKNSGVKKKKVKNIAPKKASTKKSSGKK